MTSDAPLVLIVDDDGDTRTMLTQCLAGAGLASQSAASGEEALRLAALTPPDLVLMDGVMPGLSGFEACRLFKAQPALSHAPVVFMTGLAETEHVVEGFRAGGVDYVTKPVVLDELIARIRVHLATARMALSARSALDVAGRALLAADVQGRVLWRTPQAAALLETAGAGYEAELESALRLLAQTAANPGAVPWAADIGGRRMLLAYMGETAGEHFFRLNLSLEGREVGILRDALKLTTREADVLFWIARGKSNRDISEILNISARTVNKHLEQVFTKLGVENRAAAAAIATRVVVAYG